MSNSLLLLTVLVLPFVGSLLAVFLPSNARNTAAALTGSIAAVSQEVGGGIIAQQADRIDHGDHRVEPGDIGKAVAVLVAEFESGCDGQGFGDAGGFDQQIIEPVLFGELAHLVEQIVA